MTQYDDNDDDDAYITENTITFKYKSFIYRYGTLSIIYIVSISVYISYLDFCHLNFQLECSL